MASVLKNKIAFRVKNKQMFLILEIKAVVFLSLFSSNIPASADSCCAVVWEIQMYIFTWLMLKINSVRAALRHHLCPACLATTPACIGFFLFLPFSER